MKKKQLEHWLHAYKKMHTHAPKIFIMGCSDLSCYSLAVEFKNKLDPVSFNGQVIYFSSLECVKEELKRLGLTSAYLRLRNTYDECGCDEFAQGFEDIELLFAS